MSGLDKVLSLQKIQIDQSNEFWFDLICVRLTVKFYMHSVLLPFGEKVPFVIEAA